MRRKAGRGPCAAPIRAPSSCSGRPRRGCRGAWRSPLSVSPEQGRTDTPGPMRVAMYYSVADIRIEEMPVPSIGPGELLVRVRASGICGSDVMEWYRARAAPLVLGHEIAGEVAAVGGGVDRFRVGDRVFVTHHVPCGKCRYCRQGHPSVCDTLRRTHF